MRIYLYSRAQHEKAQSQLFWGDYWVREELAQALGELGHTISSTPYQSDLNIFCWGKAPARNAVPKGRRNVAWFYSHPDLMSTRELRRYEIVFCSSALWIEEETLGLIHKADATVRFLSPCSRLFGTANPVLIAPTGDRTIIGRNFVAGSDRIEGECPDVVFVGNARPSRGGRPVVQFLLDQKELPFTFGLWGRNWERAGKHWVAEYRPFDRLQDIYYSSKVVLVDHHPDMARRGFLKHQVLDVIAAGGLPLVDGVSFVGGHESEYGAPWPVYRTREEMLALLETLTKMDESERAEMRRQICDNIGHITFVDVAETILATVGAL